MRAEEPPKSRSRKEFNFANFPIRDDNEEDGHEQDVIQEDDNEDDSNEEDDGQDPEDELEVRRSQSLLFFAPALYILSQRMLSHHFAG